MRENSEPSPKRQRIDITQTTAYAETARVLGSADPDIIEIKPFLVAASVLKIHHIAAETLQKIVDVDGDIKKAEATLEALNYIKPSTKQGAWQFQSSKLTACLTWLEKSDQAVLIAHKLAKSLYHHRLHPSFSPHLTLWMENLFSWLISTKAPASTALPKETLPSLMRHLLFVGEAYFQEKEYLKAETFYRNGLTWLEAQFSIIDVLLLQNWFQVLEAQGRYQAIFAYLNSAFMKTQHCPLPTSDDDTRLPLTDLLLKHCLSALPHVSNIERQQWLQLSQNELLKIMVACAWQSPAAIHSLTEKAHTLMLSYFALSSLTPLIDYMDRLIHNLILNRQFTLLQNWLEKIDGFIKHQEQRDKRIALTRHLVRTLNLHSSLPLCDFYQRKFAITLGDHLAKAGKNEQAVLYYKSGLALGSAGDLPLTEKERLWFKIGEAQLALGHLQDTDLAFTRSLECIDTTDKIALKNVEMHWRQIIIEESASETTQSWAYYQLANVLKKLGKPNEAEGMFQLAQETLKKYPGNPIATSMLSVISKALAPRSHPIKLGIFSTSNLTIDSAVTTETIPSLPSRPDYSGN